MYGQGGESSPGKVRWPPKGGCGSSGSRLKQRWLVGEAAVSAGEATQHGGERRKAGGERKTQQERKTCRLGISEHLSSDLGSKKVKTSGLASISGVWTRSKAA